MLIETGECGLIQTGDGIAEQNGSHFLFATGKVMVEAGFAEPGCSSQLGEGCAFVAAGHEYRRQLRQQRFP